MENHIEPGPASRILLEQFYDLTEKNLRLNSLRYVVKIDVIYCFAGAFPSSEDDKLALSHKVVRHTKPITWHNQKKTVDIFETPRTSNIVKLLRKGLGRRHLRTLQSSQSSKSSHGNDGKRTANHSNLHARSYIPKVLSAHFDENRDTQNMDNYAKSNSVKYNMFNDESDILNINERIDIKRDVEDYNVTSNGTTENYAFGGNYTTAAYKYVPPDPPTSSTTQNTTNDEPYLITTLNYTSTTTLDSFNDTGSTNKKIRRAKHLLGHSKSKEDLESKENMNEASFSTLFRNQHSEETSWYSTPNENESILDHSAVDRERDFETDDDLSNEGRNLVNEYSPNTDNKVFQNQMDMESNNSDDTIPTDQNTPRYTSADNVPADQDNPEYTSDIKTRSKNSIGRQPYELYDEEYEEN
ncbi:hypothetical protein TNIN_149241 [Trichonephila inaurata madagascariensis]|uniref:Uncharacterized protein n=1 Tax=Trichonephila inaurata madagascariensis TaxID=2747483 RepID=A0A8X6XTC7_9ARAC|nr:hypothetical protein TNIN_149241 [Trichonephila inaurata madagascariensis]